jgi:integrase
MITRGCVRTSINRQVGRIKRMFRWGVENEYIPVEIYTALCTVAGLKKGRSKAKESDGIKPVSPDMIDAVKPFVSRQVWGMIQLQILTGMRPGEVVQMRGCDLNMSGNVWEYRPESHKTEHHGSHRVVFLGPRAKAVVRQFLKTDLQAHHTSLRMKSNILSKISPLRRSPDGDLAGRAKVAPFRISYRRSCFRFDQTNDPVFLNPDSVYSQFTLCDLYPSFHMPSSIGIYRSSLDASESLLSAP